MKVQINNDTRGYIYCKGCHKKITSEMQQPKWTLSTSMDKSKTNRCPYCNFLNIVK